MYTLIMHVSRRPPQDVTGNGLKKLNKNLHIVMIKSNFKWWFVQSISCGNFGG